MKNVGKITTSPTEKKIIPNDQYPKPLLGTLVGLLS